MAIDAESICRIIKASAKSGVRHLKIEGLEIAFDSGSQPEDQTAYQNQFPWARPSKQAQLNPLEPPQILLTEEDREMARDVADLQLSIDDPVAFEQRQIDECMEQKAQLRGADAKTTQDRRSQ